LPTENVGFETFSAAGVDHAIWGRRRNEFVVRVRPDDRALRERLARCQLELVSDGAADGHPRKRCGV